MSFTRPTSSTRAIGLAALGLACAPATPVLRSSDVVAPPSRPTCNTPANLDPPSCIASEDRGALLRDERGFRVFNGCIYGIVVEHFGAHIATPAEVNAITDSHRAAIASTINGKRSSDAISVGFTGSAVSVSLETQEPDRAVEWLLPLFADTGDTCFGIQIVQTGPIGPL